MRVNEVRKTETIEKLVRTEYIAEDGTVFRSEEECIKYEESALFAISKELKRLDNKKNGASEYDIYYAADAARNIDSRTKSYHAANKEFPGDDDEAEQMLST